MSSKRFGEISRNKIMRNQHKNPNDSRTTRRMQGLISAILLIVEVVDEGRLEYRLFIQEISA